MLGWIIPEPLAMPPMRTRRPPNRASRAICLSTRSVVRIARAAASPPSLARAATSGSRPAMRVSIGIGTPITPVEQMSTSSAAKSSRWARAAVAARLSARPRSPVQALAWPELVSTARARPPLAASRSAQRSTQAARTNEVVKLPAQTAPSGASSRERSGLPEGLRPAVIPAARKPAGAVRPPGMGSQGLVMAGRMAACILPAGRG